METITVRPDKLLDNASRALQDSSASQSPSLWLAVYDPKLGLVNALRMNYTRMVLIGASGIVAVNLGLTYRQALNYPPAYDYRCMCSAYFDMPLKYVVQ